MKIATGQWDDHTTGCLLGYQYFKEIYKLIVISQCKQKSLNVDPKVIQQISFMGYLECTGGITMFFIIKEIKETVLGFSQGTLKVFWTRSVNSVGINMKWLSITVQKLSYQVHS